MKKIILTLGALFVSLVLSFAQTTETTSVQTREGSDLDVKQGDKLLIDNEFNKNWELGLMIGTQAYLAEYMRFNPSSPHGFFKFKDWWQPAVDLYIQKWASPMFGLGFGLNVAGFTGLYSPGDTRATFRRDGVDKRYSANENFFHAHGAYGNLFAKANFNVLNILCGYNPKRVFEWTGYLGGGVMIPMSKCQYFAVGATFNAGLNFQWKVTERWLLGFSVRGALISDGFNGINYVSSGDVKNVPLDGMLGATIGFSHKFGYVNRKNVKTGKVSTYEWIPETVAVTSSAILATEVANSVNEVTKAKDAEINSIKEEDQKIINSLKEKNSALESQLNVKTPAKKYWAHINFSVNKWNITNVEKVAILAAADYIKNCPEQKFYVRGYADKQTARPDHNKMLSTNRANAVRDMLVNEFGVNPDQLIVEYRGGVDYMFFDEAQCSRSVIISNQE